MIVLLLLVTATAADDGVFDIRYPSVVVAAQDDGNVSLQAGRMTQDLHVLPGPNGGSVYLEDVDLRHIIQIATSLPPVWSAHAHVGFFGTFKGEEKVDLKLEAEDPEGGTITFALVAGDLPPGIKLNGTTGHVVGEVPDETNSYSFTIRALDSHNKYADAVFRMETLEFDHCTSNPCQNNGECTDTKAGFTCNCTITFGGQKCEYACTSRAVGVQHRYTIPDAQMTAYQTYSTLLPSNGRYAASGYGWCGEDSNSWLQIDLGNLTRIYRVMTQGYSRSQYTTAYTLACSTDGNIFQKINGTNGNDYTFLARYSSSPYFQNLPTPIVARFIRFHPTSYSRRPCLKVEVYGCHVYGSE
ncbi:EGF-like repeat and discoidin I-like domain-containing protein 3 [Ylistrum balloti]|uniref:EGF-like repeat and discoidin I-like domain-containing protein 3 n=1 Tax=Ylistrum balloti TaxID=509963 RepID=UPI002905DB1C|nr:EGF-like repeat and discoidin I-like domain-containing protein 3 [Ylistrum balloti]